MFKKRTPMVADPDGMKLANEELLRKVDMLTNQLDESHRELESSRHSHGLAMEAVRSKHELELAEKDLEVKKQLADKELETRTAIAEMQIRLDRVDLDMKDKFMDKVRGLDELISDAKVSDMRVLERDKIIMMLEEQLRVANENLRIAYEALADGRARLTSSSPRRGGSR